VYVGAAWTFGSFLFGAIVIVNSRECRISKQYLCQLALLMAGVVMLAFTSVDGHSSRVMFCWTYGVFYGGYHYMLKMYLFEKVRARNFARAWGFAQCAAAIPNCIGVTVAGKLIFPTLSKIVTINVMNVACIRHSKLIAIINRN
jgi:hypothetical protein